VFLICLKQLLFLIRAIHKRGHRFSQESSRSPGAQHARSSSAVITSMLRVTAGALLLFHTVVAINIIPVDLASGKSIRCSEISISDTSLAYLCGIF
jgi:hypothetical protein